MDETREVENRLAMPLRDAMETQRAIRRLLPNPVEDSTVLRLLELALKAPTGSNAQNWEWVVVKDPTIKTKLRDRYRSGWGVYQRLSRRVRADLPEDQLQKRLRTRSAVEWQIEHFNEVPVIVVACLRGLRPPLPEWAVSSYYGSIYPAVQNLLLAARAVGLGATLVTIPLHGMSTARRILGLPRAVTPCCVIPLGWPQGRYGPTTRRPVGEVVHLNRYGNRPWLNDEDS